MEELKKQWQILPTWQKYLVSGAFPLAITYLIFSFLLSPAREQVLKLKKQKQELENSIRILTLQLNPAKLSALKKQLEEKKKKLEKEEKELGREIGKVIKKADIGKTLDFIERSRKESGVEISYISWGAISKTTFFLNEVGGRKFVSENGSGVNVSIYKGEITLGVLGSWENIFNFMRSLKKSFVSYPQGLRLERTKDGMKADLRLYVLMLE